MKILREYDLSNKDLDELTRAIQNIQEDITSVRGYNKQKWIARWLDKSGLKRSEAIKEIHDERKKEII
tara:strand:+ start:92 stop:295 length:204 start_codon:yes stop_codon:yes gene_type:complete